MKKALADALSNRGYDKLTPVQEAVTDPELGHSDLLVSAQTGSGKTVGFGLAISETLLGEAETFERATTPLALIIAPTRELALQVKRELAWLYANTNAIVASCVGGMDMRDERRALGRGAHMVVATPGRLRDHVMRGSIDLSALHAVVLDEADEMLDLGFREDLEFILGECPAERRTLMFSATVPKSIANLAKNYQKDAVRVSTTAEKSQHTDIAYRALNVAQRDGENAIINILRYYESDGALVFCNTRAMVNRVTTRLSNRGFSVVALSGELSQTERTHALQAMRDGRAKVCVATDVAARGIDLPNLDLVVHAELPSNHETLLHRSGRTGRAGRKGISALIITPKVRRKAERIMNSAKVKPEWGTAPSAEDVREQDEIRLMADPSWHQEITASEAPAVEKLAALFDANQLAAAYLRLYSTRQSAPEELSAPGADSTPRPRSAFGASVWFSIQGGRNADAEPRRLLPMLCKIGGMTKDDIGAIRIGQDESYVQILESSVDGFLSAIGKKMTVEAGAKVTQLDRPPALAKSPRPKFKDKPRRVDTKKIDWNDDPTPRHKKPKGGYKGSGPRSDRPEDNRPEGVITPYKGKPKGSPKKPKKGNPSLPTPKGKPTSKKNRARNAAAAAGQKSGKPK